MKPIIIRKADCGHWSIVQVIDTGDYIFYRTAAHVKSFSDVLLILNDEMEVIING